MIYNGYAEASAFRRHGTAGCTHRRRAADAKTTAARVGKAAPAEHDRHAAAYRPPARRSPGPAPAVTGDYQAWKPGQ